MLALRSEAAALHTLADGMEAAIAALKAREPQIARKLTPADAIELGQVVKSFRDTHSGTCPATLRKFGFLRLWHAENHRKKYGANYRWRYEQILAEAHEAFRLSQAKGKRLP